MLIDRLCDEYELALRDGRSPQIEDYLSEVPFDHREELRVELLRIEIDRLRENDAPGPDELRDRHPALAETIERLWEEAERADGTLRVVRHRFRVIEPMRQGGEAVIFLARDEDLGSTVVVKELRWNGPVASRDVERFRNEARVTSLLEHPGILPIYAVGWSGRDEIRPYFVMRHVPGPTFHEVIKEFHDRHALQRRSEWTIALRGILRRYLEICDVVRYAHSRGVVHRDLKPANLMAGPHGETIVIDWGIARVIGDLRDDEPPRADGVGPGFSAAAGLTREGEMFGTPGFASPEQYEPHARATGFTSDVYGLGATLYQLLTGRRPFHEVLGDHDEVTPQRLAALIEAIHCSPPRSPRSVERRVPRPLDAICRRALQADPAARYPSVEALAGDVAAWLDGESVSVHPDGLLVRLLAWARRHRLIAGVILGLVGLGLGLGGATGLSMALARARVEPLVDRIEAASLDRVAELVEDLRSEGAPASDILRNRLKKADAIGKRSLALALAGISGKDGDLLARMLASDPAFRRELVSAMTQRYASNPSAALRLERLLRPFVTQLVEELLANQGQAVEAWDVARGVLIRFVPQDRPDVLARCLADSNDAEFREILARMRTNPEASLRALQEELAQTRDLSSFRPIDPTWSEPDPAALAAIERAEGVVNSRFLVCLSLPIERFRGTSDALRPSGYRPLRLRPYVGAEGDLRTAVIWSRDGARYTTVEGVDAESVTRLDESHRAEGLVPIDVAIFPAPTTGEPRYAAIWVEKDPAYPRKFRDRVRTPLQAAWLGDPLPDSRLVVGLDWERAKADAAGQYESRWWSPVSQFLERPDGSMLVAQVRENDAGFERAFDVSLCDAESLPDRKAHGLFQNDVCLDAGNPDTASPLLMLTSREPGWFASTMLSGIDSKVLIEQMRELASRDYHPHSVSVQARRSGRLGVASLWKKGRIHPHRSDHALKIARLAIALFNLGETQTMWSLLRHGSDPTERTQVVEMLAKLGPPMGAFLERMETEPDVSVRRAILLALGGYEPLSSTHPFIAYLREMIRQENDPGLRSSAMWLLGTWGLDGVRNEAMDSIPRCDVPVPPERRWFINREGQTFSVIREPVAFTMGEPVWDMTDERLTMPHRVRIDRDFAIGATEVSREEFQSFREEMTRAGKPLDGKDGSRFGRDLKSPVLGVSFFDAARYCNWLSERAGIPPSQWCFEEDEGAIRLALDYLTRTGYRLPTEAEWEYACRAGSVTSRPFGRTDYTFVIRAYAWFIDGGARNHAWPTARLKPNDLGIFDMLGNAHEWCLDPKAVYCRGHCDREMADVESPTPLTREGNRILRGGWFNMPANGLTSGHRSWSWAAISHFEAGFRLARTLP